MRAAYLVPEENARLRLGTYSLDETFEHIPSDTLFSGFLNCASLLYGKTVADEFLKAALDGNLRLSSAFPRLEIFENDNLIQEWLFLPKPMMGFGKAEGEEIQKKFLKKIKYVELSLLKDCLSSVEESNGFLRTSFSFSEETIFPLFSKFAIQRTDFENLAPIANIKSVGKRKELFENLKTADFSPFNDDTIPKVVIDRLTSSSEIYGETDLFLLERNFRLFVGKEFSFRPSFLFFFEISDPLERKFQGALSLLIEEGIGGKRSQGSGKFRGIKYSETSIEHIGDKYSINLSLLFPEKSDLSSIISYEWILRGGYITSGRGTQYLKKPVRMFKEGSVFKGTPRGDAPIVSTEEIERILGHPVYQYGFNFPLIFGE